MINIIIIIYLSIICYIYYYITIFYENRKTLLLITVISCNRYNYLNRTLFAFLNHLLLYEKNLKYNIIYLDQGTSKREYIAHRFKILNMIFMNPIGYAYSFNIVFSYLYTKYVLFLEDDWEVVNNIEKYIYYPSFIMESIQILEYVREVYGILLRNIKDINVIYSLVIVTRMGKHILNILKPQRNRYSFTNGASIYRSSDLKYLDYYTSEYSTSQYFKFNNYKMGFTYKGLSGGYNSSSNQFVMKHIGKITTRKGKCNIWLY